MNFNKIIIFTIASVILTFSGCGGGAGNNSPANNAGNANANVVKNQNSSLETNKTPEETTVNKAETITPVYKAYCDAMTKKDEAAIRKIYSQDTLKSFEADMKADGIKTLVEFLSTDKVTNKLCEVRNEEIKGDTAVAEVRAEGYPNGIKVKFIKENGEWKMTNQSPDFNAVKQSATNTAK